MIDDFWVTIIASVAERIPGGLSPRPAGTGPAARFDAIPAPSGSAQEREVLR
jgi:hypothetical protein